MCIKLLAASYLKQSRIVIDSENSDGFVPAYTRQLPFLEQVEVEADNEFRMVIETIYDLLRITIPNQGAHIVTSTRQDVCMVWTEFYPAHGECMSCEHHNGRFSSAPQIPHLDRVISAGCRHEVLILVKVH